MRKTLLALAAAATIGTGTLANPTPSQAHPAVLLVVAIVVVAIFGTVVVEETIIHHHHHHHKT